MLLDILLLIFVSMWIVLTNWYLLDDNNYHSTLYAGIIFVNIMVYYIFPGKQFPFGVTKGLRTIEPDSELSLLLYAIIIRDAEVKYIRTEPTMPLVYSHNKEVLALRRKLDNFLIYIIHDFPQNLRYIYMITVKRLYRKVMRRKMKVSLFLRIRYGHPNFMVMYRHYSNKYGFYAWYIHYRDRNHKVFDGDRQG